MRTHTCEKENVEEPESSPSANGLGEAGRATLTSLDHGAAVRLRRAWGRFATGVTVVTVRTAFGARGMTANSFTSVSLDPPLVLVSIDCRARTHGLVEAHGQFAVSVLADDQREFADRFAGRLGPLQEHFGDVPHHLTVEGLTLIDGALATFVCRVIAVHPAGDHSLFIAQVERFEASDADGDQAPLVFFSGKYRSLSNPVESEPPVLGNSTSKGA